MELRPNDLPCMEKGEVRRVTVNVSGAAGINGITSATATADNLTIGAVSYSGLNITFTVSATETGCHKIIVSADLDSNETIKGFIRAKVVDSTHEHEHRYG